MSTISTASSVAPIADEGSRRTAKRFCFSGRVQGFGVRPAIYRSATSLDLAGFVENTPGGVSVYVEGNSAQVDEFAKVVVTELPAGAEMRRFTVEAVEPAGLDDFSIIRGQANDRLSAPVPVDLAVCNACLTEIFAPQDRRSRYPFTSCTQCGPRYTIIRSMPYERADTTMSHFVLCRECRAEYEQPANRRFHAQTNACQACGPRILEPDDLSTVCSALRTGGIVGLRGLGGYHLLVDGTSELADRRLRERKHRPAKPLAVMVDSLRTAELLAILDAEERAALADPSNPIVLVRAKRGADLAPSVHPGLDTVGLILPTTPLHALLLRDAGVPLVCTSGNLEGEPLEYEIQAAESRLAQVSDLFVHHNRPIERPIDDSVVRMIAGRRVTLRLGRGMAPLALYFDNVPIDELPPILALGGYLKSAVAWWNGSQAVLGPHIGDQVTVASRERFVQQLGDWQRLYRFEPKLLVHDNHPDYFSTRWAREHGAKTMAVQHHHAHVVSGMLEHGWLDREVLGVAWDGTGYGDDGSIWGGEFLLARAASYRRFASFRPFRLPGGEAAIRQPWRIAVSLLSDLAHAESPIGELSKRVWPDVDPNDIASVRQIASNATFSSMTTSAGRFFDAIAALVLGIARADFDGQAPMSLEAAADTAEQGQYRLPVIEGELLRLDWRPLMEDVLADLTDDVPPGTIAMRFHRALAVGVIEIWKYRSDLPLVLSGGVFQNRLLTETIANLFPGSPHQLGLPGLIPPNDGGLAAGQLAIAIARSID